MDRGLVSRETGYPLPSTAIGPETKERPEQQGRRPQPLELRVQVGEEDAV